MEASNEGSRTRTDAAGEGEGEEGAPPPLALLRLACLSTSVTVGAASPPSRLPSFFFSPLLLFQAKAPLAASSALSSASEAWTLCSSCGKERSRSDLLLEAAAAAPPSKTPLLFRPRLLPSSAPAASWSSSP